jgi:hypothetical protein
MRKELDKKVKTRVEKFDDEEVEMMRVNAKDLSQIFKSKKDIYRIFSTSGQIYLPPFDDCTLDYLRGLMNNTKKVTSNLMLI